MTPRVKIVMLLALGLGTTLTFSSTHWILAWLGMEITAFAILPLMIQHQHPRASEASAKYFVIQSTASIALLCASIINGWSSGHWVVTAMDDPLAVTMATMALSMKLGLVPFHTWLPEVMVGIDITTGLILSTWQKLAPLALLLQLPSSQTAYLLVALGLASIFMGGLAGINQVEFRKVLAYSSISHFGWMAAVIPYSTSTATIALCIYLATTTATFLLVSHQGTLSIKSIAMNPNKSFAYIFAMAVVLFSLAGLPPLTGFLPKLLILYQLADQGLYVLASLAALSSLFSLYFYLHFLFLYLSITAPHSTTTFALWRIKSQDPTFPLAFLIVTSTVLLPTAPAVIALFN